MPAARKSKTESVGKSELIVVFILGLLVGYSFFLLSPEEIFEKMTESTAPANITPIAMGNQATANIVAVSSDGSGVIGTATVEIVPGKDRVLISTNPFIEPDTQLSAETAKAVAEKYAGMSLSQNDVVISFNMTAYNGGTNAQVVGGPSAGAAMTLAMIAAIEGKAVRSDVATTGTIEPDGTIGSVGGVLEKAQAAGKNGMKIFLVPKGLNQIVYYEKQVQTQEIAPGYVIQKVSYVPKTLNLGNYTQQQWGMLVIEISNINDAAKYGITETKAVGLAA